MILRTAGTNCDEETAYAWELAGADPRRIHVRELMNQPTLLREYAILTIPGGFSYGDDISAGKILANQLIYHLGKVIGEFVSTGKFVLGICNGFQVLVKAGLLPGGGNGDALGQQVVTLTQNDSARFEDRWVHLRTGDRDNAFLPANTILSMPIAHAEGKLVAGPEISPDELIRRGHVAVTYCDANGKRGSYPVNPNGSDADIAGLTDITGRILGLMPHPERHVHPTQHPFWTRNRDQQPGGRILFENAVKAANSL